MKKRKVSLMVVCVLVIGMFFTLVQTYADQGEIKVLLNGKTLNFDDQSPVIENDRTLVPMRAIFEALGAKIQWLDNEETIIGEKDGVKVALKIGSKVVKVNDKDVELDVPAKLVNDRTMVPLRFVGESLGAKVQWMEATQTITIDTQNATPTIAPNVIPTPTPKLMPSATPSVTANPAPVSSTAQGQKLAIQKATATVSEPDHKPMQSIDGDMATRWSGNMGIITYDLGVEKKVDGVSIAWYLGNQRKYNFKIEVSKDNKTWSTALDASQSTGKTNDFENYVFSEVPARYVRITGMGSSANKTSHIVELGIYGE